MSFTNFPDIFFSHSTTFSYTNQPRITQNWQRENIYLRVHSKSKLTIVSFINAKLVSYLCTLQLRVSYSVKVKIIRKFYFIYSHHQCVFLHFFHSIVTDTHTYTVCSTYVCRTYQKIFILTLKWMKFDGINLRKKTELKCKNWRETYQMLAKTTDFIQKLTNFHWFYL